MKPATCLKEQDLILCHYGELPADGHAPRHLETCPDCRRRLEALAADLARLPQWPIEVEEAAATRMAARVSERLQRRSPRWLPALGGGLAAVAALAITLVVWPPVPSQPPNVQPRIQVANTVSSGPDIELLEDLEVLENLELLRQIEGV